MIILPALLNIIIIINGGGLKTLLYKVWYKLILTRLKRDFKLIKPFKLIERRHKTSSCFHWSITWLICVWQAEVTLRHSDWRHVSSCSSSRLCAVICKFDSFLWWKPLKCSSGVSCKWRPSERHCRPGEGGGGGPGGGGGRSTCSGFYSSSVVNKVYTKTCWWQVCVCVCVCVCVKMRRRWGEEEREEGVRRREVRAIKPTMWHQQL